MNNKRILTLSVIAIIIIIVLIIGGTFAYWQWNTNSTQHKTINFIVPSTSDQISASLDGGGTDTVSKLAPAECTDATYAMKKELTLTYKNLSTQAATISASLSVSNWTQPHTGTVDLSKIHYALTDDGTSCSSGNVIAGGANSSFVTSGALINNATLLNVPINTSERSKQYYLWVWIDPLYTYTNIGNSISDPMQDLSFDLTWTGSMTNTN